MRVNATHRQPKLAATPSQYDGNYVQRTPQMMYAIRPTHDFPSRATTTRSSTRSTQTRISPTSTQSKRRYAMPPHAFPSTKPFSAHRNARTGVTQ
jgi:hypothetical protein